MTVTIFFCRTNCSQQPNTTSMATSTGTTHIYNFDEWPFICKFIVLPLFPLGSKRFIQKIATAFICAEMIDVVCEIK
jgi:hypothetical protein